MQQVKANATKASASTNKQAQASVNATQVAQASASTLQALQAYSNATRTRNASCVNISNAYSTLASSNKYNAQQLQVIASAKKIANAFTLYFTNANVVTIVCSKLNVSSAFVQFNAQHNNLYVITTAQKTQRKCAHLIFNVSVQQLLQVASTTSNVQLAQLTTIQVFNSCATVSANVKQAQASAN